MKTIVSLFTLLTVASTASAADLTVTSIGDNGPGTLREMLSIASLTPTVDVITFDVTGDISLESTITITGGADIRGPGDGSVVIKLAETFDGEMFKITSAPDLVRFAGLTFDGTHALHSMIDAEEVDVTLEDVHFSNAFADNIEDGSGGVLDFEGNFHDGYTVTVRNCTFTNNYGNFGGSLFFVRFAGVLLIEDATFDGGDAMNKGAGIWFDGWYGGQLTIRRSTFTHLRAGSGSALEFEGHGTAAEHPTLLIESSTFYENGTDDPSDPGDSIIEVFSATTRFVNVTVANNTTPGAPIALSGYGPMTIESSTITGNRSVNGACGGVYATDNLSPRLHIVNSIIAGNTGKNVGSVLYADVFGTVTASHSLIERPGLNPMNMVPNDFSAQPDVITGQAPQLGALLDNGGSTLTMLPLATSPAVDSGDSSVIADGTLDQRGQPRVRGTAVDMGSVETDVAGQPIDPTDPDPTDPTPGGEEPGPAGTPSSKKGGCAAIADTSALGVLLVLSLLCRRRPSWTGRR